MEEPGGLAGVEKALRGGVEAFQEFVEHIEFDPHWFRRSFHALGACFVVYYILPDEGAVLGFVHAFLPLLLFVTAVLVEVYRVLGGLPTEAFFGLREYERYRLSGYVFFASAVVLLLYTFPPAVAAACIVGAAIGDPILGELRAAGHKTLGWLATGVFGAGVFAILGFDPVLSVLGGALLVAGEEAKNPLLDDDFMMPIVPAVVLVLLSDLGVLAALGMGFPDPFVHKVGVPTWLP